MSYQKNITIEEFENNEMKNQYQYLYKKGSELKGCEDESMVEYGNDFLNCKVFDSKR